jgi:hypothetical protein
VELYTPNKSEQKSETEKRLSDNSTKIIKLSEET